MEKEKSVEIGEKDRQGMHEWYDETYICPICKTTKSHHTETGGIFKSFKFCPDCGIKLKWTD